MRITRQRWRALLGLPSWRIEGSWHGELDNQDPGDITSKWTGRHELWNPEVREWLRGISGFDWMEYQPHHRDHMFRPPATSVLWLRHLSQVTMFKMIFGGKKPPREPSFSVKRTIVSAKSRAIGAKWTLN